VGEDTVADRITEDSVKLCQVGIELVQGVHRGGTSVEKFREGPESLRILRALPGGHRLKNIIYIRLLASKRRSRPQ
jgi:hypothetical protein